MSTWVSHSTSGAGGSSRGALAGDLDHPAPLAAGGTMRAIGCPHPGGPEALVVERRPVPVPSARQILVRVHAAGVNRPDVSQRRGGYPPPAGVTDIPGLEIAGEVVALGLEAERWALGDRVTALVPGGGYAEYCAVDWTNALPVPNGLSMVEAAALPETFFTVWSNVFDRGRLASGEVLLVHGGTSGIGTTAIMLGKAFGARVIVTAGSPEKCKACLDLGAEVAIDYHKSDFVEVVKEATDGHGADVILDMVGGSYVERNWRAAAIEGRILQIANLGGAASYLDFTRLMVKRLTHTGSTLRPRDVAFKAAIARSLEEKVWPLIEAGTVRPVIHKTFPLVDACASHGLMETSSHIGKIVLTLD